MSNDDRVHCDGHGEGWVPGFLCTHLADRNGHGWHDAEDGSLCPDGWCDACEQQRLAAGGWDQLPEGEAQIVMLCGACHNTRLGEHKAQAHPGRDLESLLEEAWTTMGERNQQMIEGFDLGSYDGFWFDLEDQALFFKNGDTVGLRCEVTFLGSYSERGQSWMWGWANRHIPNDVRTRCAQVMGFGQALDLQPLTHGVLETELEEAWELAMLGAWLLDATGFYRAPSGPSHLFFAVHRLEVIGHT